MTNVKGFERKPCLFQNLMLWATVLSFACVGVTVP